MVRNLSNTPSAGVLTLVLLLASSLLALAKPEDVLTADITEGKVGRLSPASLLGCSHNPMIHSWMEENLHAATGSHRLVVSDKSAVPSDSR